MKTTNVAEICAEFGKEYHVHGRVRSKRSLGGLIFLTVQDQSGTLQLSIESSENEALFAKIHKSVKSWDIILATGSVYSTARGALTLRLSDLKIEAKPLKTINARGKAQNICRTNQILADQKTFGALLFRAHMYAEIRRILNEEGFLEFETPILLNEETTSKARSFATLPAHNSPQYFLRKCPEQHLKMLLISGFERVYEIGKIFRNESSTKFHQVEFSVLEAYHVGWSYRDMESFFLRLLSQIEQRLKTRKSLLNFNVFDFKNVDTTRSENDSAHTISDMLKTARGANALPLLMRHLPSRINPLSEHDADGHAKEFRFYVDGHLLAHGNSEITDYSLQRQLFEQQAIVNRREYNPEADSFLQSLKFGMPCCSGIGIGLDRLVLSYAEHSDIKHTIPFPKS